jgi:predicted ester cyclase
MSASNDPAGVLRNYLAAGDHNELDEFERWLHPDVVVHSAGGMVSRGVSAQRATWTAAHSGLDGLRHLIEELVVAGNTVAARVVASGTHHGTFLGIPPTGNQVRVDQALFAHVRDGQITELWEIVDTGSGMQQLGLLVDQALGFDAGDT